MRSRNTTFVTRMTGQLAVIVAGIGFLSVSAWSATYYSQGSLAPNLTTSWNSARDGSGAPPGGFAAGDAFVIQNGHAMETTAGWSITGVNASLTIESGGTLQADQITAVPVFAVLDGGTYIHNATGSSTNGSASDLPGSSSRVFGPASNVEFRKWANGGTSPTALPTVDWGNLTINVATLGGAWNQQGQLSSVHGNLNIQTTGGTREFRFVANSPATASTVVLGDLNITGGILNLDSGTAAYTLSLGGSFNFTGGTFTSTGTGGATVVFTGGASTVQMQKGSLVTAYTVTNVNWRIAAGKTVSLLTNFSPGAWVAASRTMQVDGTLQIADGAYPGNAGTWTYSSTGVLAFANTSASFTVNNDAWWPATNGPSTVTVATGGITMATARTVPVAFSTTGPVSGTALTLNGTATLLAGGSIASAPFYGGASTLIYSSGGTFGAGAEWSSGSGAGFPNNVTVASGTFVTGPGTLSCGSNFQVTGGNAVTVSSGGTLRIGGALTADGTFNASAGSLVFAGAGSFSWSGAGPQSYGAVIVDRSGGSVSLDHDVTCSTLTVTNGGLQLQPIALTVTGDVSIAAGASLTDQSGTSVTAGGNLAVPGSWNGGAGTLLFTGTGDWTSGSASQSFGSVNVAPGASVRLRSDAACTGVSLNGACTLDVHDPVALTLHTVTLGAGSQLALATGGRVVLGSASPAQLTNNGGGITGDGTVEIAGPGTATLGGSVATTVPRLHVTSTAAPALTLTQDLTVATALQLDGGAIATASHAVILAPGASATATSSGVDGVMTQRLTGPGAATRSFPMAVGPDACAVTVAASAVTSDGNLTVQVASGLPSSIAGSGLAGNRRLDRTITLTPDGSLALAGTSDVTVDHGGHGLEGSATPAAFVMRTLVASTWAPTTRVAVSPTSETGRLTLAGGATQLALGDQAIHHYDVSGPGAPVTAGSTFPVGVVARDLLGETVPDDNTTAVTMTSSGATQFDANGDATFDDPVKTLTGGQLTIATRDPVGETMTVTATDPGGATGTSSPITVTVGPAATIAFTQQPTATPVSGTITPAVVVRVTDALGNGVPAELVQLQLTGGGQLGGTVSRSTDASGNASFGDLTVDHGGTHHLSATSGSLGPLASDPFDVTCPALSLSPATLPDATAGTAYSQTFSASGGVTPYAYAVVTGTLPAGLALDAASGLLSGTPTTGDPSSFDVRATDAAGCTVQRSYTLVVQGGCPVIAVLPAALPGASVGIAYNQTLTASAGTAPFSFVVSAGALPAGFTLTSAGVLSGTSGAAGTASFTVQTTDANGCTGSTGYSVTTYVVPTAITTLATQQITTGNPSGTTTGVRVNFTLPPAASSVEVYRAPFGGYPTFGGGAVPAVPSYPPGAPWTLTTVASSGDVDSPPGRDYWYYVAFAKNPAGGVSGVSNRSGGSLDYHLGDFADGVTPGNGDNQVNTIDVSLLGAHYGLQGAAVAPYAYLDIGPTSDHSVNGRPLPDQLIGFEDLVLVAINFNVASAPPVAHAADGTPAIPAGPDEVTIEAPIRVLRGQSVTVRMKLHGAGDLQALSVRLGWDPAVVTPDSWTSEGFVESRGGVVLSPGPGGVDAAVLGARTGGLAGDGTLATITFRVVGDGDPRFRAETLDGRDVTNASVVVKGIVTAPIPMADGLSFAMPNPSRDQSTLEMSLAHPAVVDLAIFDLDGRRVRTLASGAWQAGLYRMAWDGLDDRGHRSPAGMYFARLSAAGAGYTRRVVRLP